MESYVRKIHDFYAMKPDAPIVQNEFGYFTLGKWQNEGWLKKPEEGKDYQEYLNDVFGLEPYAMFFYDGLGWCEAGLSPDFKVEALESNDKYELVRDHAGREVLYFKGRRDGFMPTYKKHPAASQKDWEENVKWRLDPATPARKESSDAMIRGARAAREKGYMISQRVIGGYMYLRSLVGPGDLPYYFYDEPELLHDMMQTWLDLADKVIAYHQAATPLDELFLGEDICYNHGCLISPEMFREFLQPYYRQLIENVRKRNDGRKLHIQIDTDGFCVPMIPLYRELGMDYMSPFEVASGCDVVQLGQLYPDLLIRGGIDKRMIAKGGDDIKRHLDRIMPAMKKRGGYIPCCDHGVPEETSFENYMLYRTLMREYAD